jgi:hypothetical protein
MKSLIVAAALLAACTKVTYVNPTIRAGGVQVSQTGHFFIFGLAGEANVPAYQMCPTGVAAVQSKFTFGDLVLQFITIGIYTPRTYQIQCGA